MQETGLPHLPGAATVSEVLRLLELGYTEMKFFPAEASGGVDFLKSIGAPVPQARFCPTGGITTASASSYLALANVGSPNAGNYSVVVTNAFGSVTSRVAVLMFTTVHRIEGIMANPDHSISLTLAGVVPRPFAPYYDLYPLEVSTDLVDWSPLTMLQRTNDSSDALSYLDPGATNFEKRFYRTATNFLVTPFPKPSGPYSVGTFSRLMTDPSRIRHTLPTSSSFMVTFWYPAEGKTGALPNTYFEKELTVLFPEYWIPRAASTVDRFVSHALPGVSLATNQSQLSCVDLLTQHLVPATKHRQSGRTGQSWIRRGGFGSRGC